ncbi:MerR family transcriptional regulator [Halobacillus kuroshimensis]|uniref:MerR family transcriptional regulator n=1 Tax=Halobacillus kuroshimensis TaxID=302481 RepID=UPI0003FD478B|nr:MerR family transcriptional regulator [Halobacillus kuroshimensis]
MKRTFTIGQMSKLNNISVKTLRYYDDIGLFVPYEVDPQTGYRYYSMEQFKKLDMITFLKNMGVPLREIKRKVEHSTVDEFMEVLAEYKQKNEDLIDDLTRMNRLLRQKISELESSKDHRIRNQTNTEFFPERSIIEVRGHFGKLDDVEEVLRELKKQVSAKSPIMVGTVGMVVEQADVFKTDAVDYSAVFITVDEKQEESHDKRKILEEGFYATTYVKAQESRNPAVYQNILENITNAGWQTDGPFLVRTIVESFISHKEEEHIREIQMKVKQ